MAHTWKGELMECTGAVALSGAAQFTNAYARLPGENTDEDCRNRCGFCLLLAVCRALAYPPLLRPSSVGAPAAPTRTAPHSAPTRSRAPPHCSQLPSGHLSLPRLRGQLQVCVLVSRERTASADTSSPLLSLRRAFSSWYIPHLLFFITFTSIWFWVSVGGYVRCAPLKARAKALRD